MGYEPLHNAVVVETRMAAAQFKKHVLVLTQFFETNGARSLTGHPDVPACDKR